MAEIVTQQDVLNARRAWSASQVLLGGSPTAAPVMLTLGWHDTATHQEVGAFAVVGADSDFADMLGDKVQVTVGRSTAIVLIVGVRQVPVDLSLCRTAFSRLAPLTAESVPATVRVLS